MQSLVILLSCAAVIFLPILFTCWYSFYLLGSYRTESNSDAWQPFTSLKNVPLYATIYRWHDLVTWLSSNLLRLSCLFIMECPQESDILPRCSLTSAEKSGPSLCSLEVKRVWWLPICLIWLSRASYPPSRTTGFLPYPGPDGMFLLCDRLTLIIWAWLQSLLGTHSVAVWLWCMNVWRMVSGGCWMTNLGPWWMLMWPVIVTHPPPRWLLPHHRAAPLPVSSPTGPLVLSPFKDVAKAQTLGC